MGRKLTPNPFLEDGLQYVNQSGSGSSLVNAVSSDNEQDQEQLDKFSYLKGENLNLVSILEEVKLINSILHNDFEYFGQTDDLSELKSMATNGLLKENSIFLTPQAGFLNGVSIPEGSYIAFKGGRLQIINPPDVLNWKADSPITVKVSELPAGSSNASQNKIYTTENDDIAVFNGDKVINLLSKESIEKKIKVLSDDVKPITVPVESLPEIEDANRNKIYVEGTKEKKEISDINITGRDSDIINISFNQRYEIVLNATMGGGVGYNEGDSVAFPFDNIGDEINTVFFPLVIEDSAHNRGNAFNTKPGKSVYSNFAKFGADPDYTNTLSAYNNGQVHYYEDVKFYYNTKENYNNDFYSCLVHFIAYYQRPSVDLYNFNIFKEQYQDYFHPFYIIDTATQADDYGSVESCKQAILDAFIFPESASVEYIYNTTGKTEVKKVSVYDGDQYINLLPKEKIEQLLASKTRIENGTEQEKGENHRYFETQESENSEQNTVKGNTEFFDNVSIKGNLTVSGENKIVHATEVESENDLITLRKNNPQGLGEETSGFKIENYDGDGNNLLLTTDRSGFLRIGDENGDLQKIATVADDAVNGELVAYNTTKNTLESKVVENATQSKAGFMSSSDKTKLDNLSKSSVGLGNVANIDQSQAIKAITRSGTTFTFTRLNGTTGTFTQQDNNTTYSAATQSAAGLMSAADKTKLDKFSVDSSSHITVPTSYGSNALLPKVILACTVTNSNFAYSLHFYKGSGNLSITRQAVGDYKFYTSSYFADQSYYIIPYAFNSGSNIKCSAGVNNKDTILVRTHATGTATNVDATFTLVVFIL